MPAWCIANLVRQSEPEGKSVVVGVGKGISRCLGGACIPGIDVGDSGTDTDRPGDGENGGTGHERLTPKQLR